MMPIILAVVFVGVIWFFLRRRKASEPPFMGLGDTGTHFARDVPRSIFKNRRTL